MKFPLYCLGTAGYHPNATRHTSSHFLPIQGIALDAGTGFFRSFPMIETSELHILLSHAHLDHIAGLSFLWNAYRNAKLKQVHVHAEPTKIAAIREHLFSQLIFPVLPNIQWHPIGPNQSFQLNGTDISTFRLQHPGDSLGFLLENSGHKLAYVTDTITSIDSEYWRVVKHADLILHECNFRTDEHEFAIQTGHSDLATLISAVNHHRVQRVVLTHFNTIDDDLASEFQRLKEQRFPQLSAIVEFASDGSRFEY